MSHGDAVGSLLFPVTAMQACSPVPPAVSGGGGGGTRWQIPRHPNARRLPTYSIPAAGFPQAGRGIWKQGRRPRGPIETGSFHDGISPPGLSPNPYGPQPQIRRRDGRALRTPPGEETYTVPDQDTGIPPGADMDVESVVSDSILSLSDSEPAGPGERLGSEAQALLRTYLSHFYSTDPRGNV